MKRLDGVRALMHDGIDAVIGLVEETHLHSAGKPIARLGAWPGVGEGAAAVGVSHAVIARLAYGSARLTNRGAEQVENAGMAFARASGLDRLAAATVERLGALDPEVTRELRYWTDTGQTALNGWIGDFLQKRDNALAVPFGFFADGRPVEVTLEALQDTLPRATPKLCVFVHGWGCNEGTWGFQAERLWGDPRASYARSLERDHGYTPLHVRYNTGLHVSENAHELDRQLEALLAAYPCEVEELVLIGHSMGGLVCRGAAHYAHGRRAEWTRKLTHLLCIGSPHLGVPYEKATHLLSSLLRRFDTPGTRVPAKVLNARSVGLKDLRFGYVLDEDWTGKDPDAAGLTDDRHDVPMLPWVTYGFVAATFTRDPEHPAGVLLGDLLVRVPSASGEAPDPTRRVRFDMGHVVPGVRHLAMLNHPDVYAQIEALLRARVVGEREAAAPELPG